MTSNMLMGALRKDAMKSMFYIRIQTHCKSDLHVHGCMESLIHGKQPAVVAREPEGSAEGKVCNTAPLRRRLTVAPRVAMTRHR